MERFNVRVGAYIFNSNKELLLLKNNRGKWGIAGGHIEKGEGLEEGLLREIEEETGIRAKIVRIVRAFVSNDDIIILYLARSNPDSITISDEHTDSTWVGIDNINDYELAYNEIAKEAKSLYEEL
jgi:8-oxo-dGTP diphosphatase